MDQKETTQPELTNRTPKTIDSNVLNVSDNLKSSDASDKSEAPDANASEDNRRHTPVNSWPFILANVWTISQKEASGIVENKDTPSTSASSVSMYPPPLSPRREVPPSLMGNVHFDKEIPETQYGKNREQLVDKQKKALEEFSAKQRKELIEFLAMQRTEREEFDAKYQQTSNGLSAQSESVVSSVQSTLSPSSSQ